MFVLRYVGGAGLRKQPCAACLGTLSFGTFREKRRNAINKERSALEIINKRIMFNFNKYSLRGLCRTHNNPCL